MYDILIKNGFLVDGTGRKGFYGDIAISDDKIIKIDDHILEKAQKVIDAEGKIVCPGFVDIHTHDDLVFDIDPMNMPKLCQGVTTVVTGNCGFGAAPATEDCFQDMVDYNTPILGKQVKNHLFERFSAYMEYMEKQTKAMNVACLIPHGNVYMSAHGFDSDPMNEQELEREIEYVNDAMDAGALGMSFGLMYAPGCYSEKEEIQKLAQEVGEKGGIVAVHMKSESDNFRKSLQEAAELSMFFHVPVEISHLKNVGKEYWGRMGDTVQWLETLLKDGADLSFDMYPYTMGSTTMAILFPTEYLKDGVKKLLVCLGDKDIRLKISQRLKEDWGEEDNLSLLCGWENVIISSVKTEKNISYLGKSVEEIAEMQNKTSDEAFMDLFLEEEGDVSILLNHILQADLEETLMFDYVCVASDGIPGAKLPHPRLYGTFPRFLREFVKEKNMFTWEQAVHKITQQPAKRFGLKNRGALIEGYFADLVVFNPDKIADLADYQDSNRYPEGIEYTIVNGQTAWLKGGICRAGQGRLLKRERV